MFVDRTLGWCYQCSSSLSFSFLYLGTTALFALLKGDILTVANVGDSRGVICDKNSKAIPLSYDHKPYNVCINCKLLF